MALKRTDNYRVVFDTSRGQLCPDCNQPREQCSCDKGSGVVGDGDIRVKKDTKGRGGKVVTVVSGVPLEPADLKKLGKELKRRCGTGGAVKEGRIEIQGDHVDKLMAELTARGHSPRRG